MTTTAAPAQNQTYAVEVHDLHVRYDRVEALQGVDFALPRGTALGIVGPNGSGKSTLLKTVAGLVQPSQGTVRVQGRPPRELPAGTIGYVPQIEDVDWQFPVTVRDVVGMGRYPRLAPFRPFSAHDRCAVARALDALDLGSLADRHISELSGGQQQRTFVARAIAQEPLLLLLDEPTTGVDAATENALLRLVRGLVADGLPVLMTTHDLDRANEWFDRLIVVDRKILADGVPDDVLQSGAYAAIREHTHVHGHHRADQHTH
ncbi:MAG: ABC transporter ATP-binding protein [Candidatus Eremiobacteraeota bacterium]|nr:ABC transporter ATP-binding protein [Candidatus Eremiobacteraeota bacterium]